MIQIARYVNCEIQNEEKEDPQISCNINDNQERYFVSEKNIRLLEVCSNRILRVIPPLASIQFFMPKNSSASSFYPMSVDSMIIVLSTLRAEVIDESDVAIMEYFYSTCKLPFNSIQRDHSLDWNEDKCSQEGESIVDDDDVKGMELAGPVDESLMNERIELDTEDSADTATESRAMNDEKSEVYELHSDRDENSIMDKASNINEECEEYANSDQNERHGDYQDGSAKVEDQLRIGIKRHYNQIEESNRVNQPNPHIENLSPDTVDVLVSSKPYLQGKIVQFFHVTESIPYAFGYPFLLYVREDDSLAMVRKKICKCVDRSIEEVQQWKIVLFPNTENFFIVFPGLVSTELDQEENNVQRSFLDILRSRANLDMSCKKFFETGFHVVLALQHSDSNNLKRRRLNRYAEQALKIHN